MIVTTTIRVSSQDDLEQALATWGGDDFATIYVRAETYDSPGFTLNGTHRAIIVIVGRAVVRVPEATVYALDESVVLAGQAATVIANDKSTVIGPPGATVVLRDSAHFIEVGPR